MLEVRLYIAMSTPQTRQIDAFSCGVRQQGQSWVDMGESHNNETEFSEGIGSMASTVHKAPARRKSSQQRHAALRSIPERMAVFPEKMRSSVWGLN
jgi:diacylglycerol kinase family enzyme